MGLWLANLLGDDACTECGYLEHVEEMLGRSRDARNETEGMYPPVRRALISSSACHLNLVVSVGVVNSFKSPYHSAITQPSHPYMGQQSTHKSQPSPSRISRGHEGPTKRPLPNIESANFDYNPDQEESYCFTGHIPFRGIRGNRPC